MPTIDELRSSMSSLPQRNDAADKSAREKVAALRAQIKELHFSKCWTWPDIAEWLTNNGCKISESTLKLYYYKSAPRKSKERSAIQNSTSTPVPTPAQALADKTVESVVSSPKKFGATSTAGKVNPVLD